jgi:glutamyl-tRNA synthetase
MVNYLVRLGWSHGDEEIFSMDELIQKFTLEGVGRSAGVFNPDKLLWLNAHYIKTGDPVRLGALLREYLAAEGVETSGGPDLPTVVKLFQDRSKTLVEMARDAAFFYRPEVAFDQEAVAKCLTAETRPVLAALVEALEGCATFDADSIGQAFNAVMAAQGLKLGKVAPAVRVAIVGHSVSPSIYDVLAALGQAETLRRLRAALALIG